MKDRSRPREAAPAETLTGSSIEAAEDVATQLRRRRAASYRLPPLNDGTGRRDPLDPVR